MLPGRYRHYKGKEYEVIDVARHSESEEQLVVYRTLYGNFELWVRPLNMFVENVEIDGTAQPRFTYLGPMSTTVKPGLSALLLIDAQVNMFDPQMPIYKDSEILEKLQKLVQMARQHRISVIYIQHNGGEGESDAHGSPGWEIHPTLQPLPGEITIQKESPSAFHNTHLHAHLQQMGIQHLVLAGMQTDFCVNATACQGLELGYQITVVQDAHSTYNSRELSAPDIIACYNHKFGSIAQTTTVEKVDFSK